MYNVPVSQNTHMMLLLRIAEYCLRMCLSWSIGLLWLYITIFKASICKNQKCYKRFLTFGFAPCLSKPPTPPKLPEIHTEASFVLPLAGKSQSTLSNLQKYILTTVEILCLFGYLTIVLRKT